MENNVDNMFFKFDDDPPEWCHPDFRKPLPMRYTKKRAQLLKR